MYIENVVEKYKSFVQANNETIEKLLPS